MQFEQGHKPLIVGGSLKQREHITVRVEGMSLMFERCIVTRSGSAWIGCNVTNTELLHARDVGGLKNMVCSILGHVPVDIPQPVNAEQRKIVERALLARRQFLEAHPFENP